MRVMGLDYGSKTVGVALSDELLLTAQPYTTIVRKKPDKLRQTYAAIEDIIKEYNVELIVLGYPKNMNNTLGERVEATDAFKEALERRTALPVILMDERLTTVQADRVLSEQGIAAADRKEYIDKIAAAIILQTYLDKKSFEAKNSDNSDTSDN